MGGFGSGRSRRASATCEDSHRVDLAYLRRHKLLRPGTSSKMTWSRGGERTGSIRFIVEPGGLRLLYTASGRNGGAKEHIDELVPFVRTTTRFSGQRLWLKCLSCHRRCRVIYGGRYFRCRRCHGLSYQSQREPACDRAIEQANRIRKRLAHSIHEGVQEGMMGGDEAVGLA